MPTDKDALRQSVWDGLEDSGEARFPFPPHGRIPNFAGADRAADRLADLPEWAAAERLKANPDAPQLPARRAALDAGKTVFMAVPRLRDERCFYRLDPAELADPDAAATVSRVADHAEQVGPDAVGRVDLVLVGSVAVSPSGARVGKGEGYSDLEFAVLTELGLVDAETTVVTTVHESQVREGIDPDAHDVPIDVVVTPERTIRTESPFERPDGVDWTALDDERVDEIPVLERFRPG
ncbi:5-formyltetrahydrofolate cyclo-ligase [Halosimplex litoreum]|uniref:5-formyltetrahydrofolate cyclo-ligase n=1 Tax=Halosimplex litoreum TaxID=1198301 RepID=A0A7T3FZU4_9EURY|nr:5-formyltetrahydrofolate cyclo-ligase [Halosimplex litoreum]QPV63770.1 5-formyltetrahydrofolate cyclo-ligase [Halosimplex litoreum]